MGIGRRHGICSPGASRTAHAPHLTRPAGAGLLPLPALVHPCVNGFVFAEISFVAPRGAVRRCAQVRSATFAVRRFGTAAISRPTTQAAIRTCNLAHAPAFRRRPAACASACSNCRLWRRAWLRFYEPGSACRRNSAAASCEGTATASQPQRLWLCRQITEQNRNLADIHHRCKAIQPSRPPRLCRPAHSRGADAYRQTGTEKFNCGTLGVAAGSRWQDRRGAIRRV